ncbi:MAG: hypothetical protein JST16_03045 [Bdellovibrionales bacterium]|nr:hypothetical protein [Bdellovibrionales bacterium]
MWELFVFALLAGLTIASAFTEERNQHTNTHPSVYHSSELSTLLLPHHGHDMY